MLILGTKPVPSNIFGTSAQMTPTLSGPTGSGLILSKAGTFGNSSYLANALGPGEK